MIRGVFVFMGLMISGCQPVESQVPTFGPNEQKAAIQYILDSSVSLGDTSIEELAHSTFFSDENCSNSMLQFDGETGRLSTPQEGMIYFEYYETAQLSGKNVGVFGYGSSESIYQTILVTKIAANKFVLTFIDGPKRLTDATLVSSDYQIFRSFSAYVCNEARPHI